MPDVEEAWAAAFQAVAWGYPEIVRQRRMAAVRDAMLTAHDDACRRCNRFGFDEPPCEKRARIQAIAAGGRSA